MTDGKKSREGEAPKEICDGPPSSILDETLIAPSRIRLFGRGFNGLILNKNALTGVEGDNSPGRANPLTDKLDPKLEPRLARIYGFTYEGNYYKLQKPYIFLVHGEGKVVKEREDISDVGLEIKDPEFLHGVFMWDYDKVDFSVRIDITSGWLEEILLDASLGSACNVTAGGIATRADLAARADLSSRADLSGRADLSARADLSMRGRFR